MNCYAESSALLAWLLREPKGMSVEAILDAADSIVTSDLTLIECDRTIHREVAIGRMTRDMARRVSTDFADEVSGWVVLRLTPPIVLRSRQPFPEEPIRSLDALHVAWAIEARVRYFDVVLLSLDDRVRRVGQSLSFEVRP